MAKNPFQYSMAVPFRREVVADVGGASLTRQEFVEECDVNELMRRYEKVGGMFPTPDAPPRYLDLYGMPDFQQAMHLLIQAEEAFMSLPAITRKEFDNDPGKFVAFAEDPKNLGKMREWKLAPPEAVEPAPARVKIVGDDREPAVPASKAGDRPAPTQ